MTNHATSMPKIAGEYSKYESCDLINHSSPVYLSELHEKLDNIDKIDFNEIVKLAPELNCLDNKKEQLTFSDLIEGLAQLATTGVVEITEIMELIHAEILLRPFGLFNEHHLSRWQKGFISQIYNKVRFTMNHLGHNLTQTGVGFYKNNLTTRGKKPLPDILKQLANVINGMLGDHLVSRNNPLAVPMVLYDRYGQPQHNELFGRVVILCHGLCLSYLSWHPCEDDCLGELLANDPSKMTVLYLDYNTGRRVSQNGQCLATLIQEMKDNNPDITQIDLVGYSMGGLVSRSALFYAEQLNLDWVDMVGNLVTIGTPHQGAGLERISHYVLELIGDIPFAGSLSKMANVRSAGIIDLRHGSTRDEDWKNLEKRDVLPGEFRYPAKLPSHIKSFFIAGSIVEALYESKASNIVGDGLVTVESALGETTGEHNLSIPEGHKAVFYGVNHFNLQYDKDVHQQVVKWLSDNGKTNFSLDLRVQSFTFDDYEIVV